MHLYITDSGCERFIQFEKIKEFVLSGFGVNERHEYNSNLCSKNGRHDPVIRS